MSEFKPSGVTEVVARPQSSASKGKTVEGNKLPPEARKEVETVPQSEKAALEKENVQAQKAENEEDVQQVEAAVAQMQDYMQNMERNLNFQLDDESGLTVIRVYDAETEELIRQIPNEEAVSLAQKLKDEEPLMLFSAKV